MNHVMIDIEALGEAPDGVLVSVGAIMFGPDCPPDPNKDGRSLYVVCGPDAYNKSRDLSMDTVCWWMQQNDSARSVFNDFAGGLTLPVALAQLGEFVAYHKANTIWANGVSYDFGILRNCFAMVNQKCPWGYRDEACMRSLRRMEFLMPDGFVKWSDRKTINTHNALADAVAQAQYVYDFMQHIRR